MTTHKVHATAVDGTLPAPGRIAWSVEPADEVECEAELALSPLTIPWEWKSIPYGWPRDPDARA